MLSCNTTIRCAQVLNAPSSTAPFSSTFKAGVFPLTHNKLDKKGSNKIANRTNNSQGPCYSPSHPPHILLLLCTVVEQFTLQWWNDCNARGTQEPRETSRALLRVTRKILQCLKQRLIILTWASDDGQDANTRCTELTLKPQERESGAGPQYHWNNTKELLLLPVPLLHIHSTENLPSDSTEVAQMPQQMSITLQLRAHYAM